MRLFFSISFSLLLLLPALQDIGVFVEFKINQQRIEQEKCVNKNVPAKACHGKCHLKKVLEENHKKDTEPGTPPSPEPIKLTYIQLQPELKKWFLEHNAKVVFHEPAGLFAHLEEKGIFHPPRRRAA